MKLTSKAAFRKLAALYKRMGDAYADAATRVGLSCADCEDNCCTSYFQHHTYVEWAYLWHGLNALPEARRQDYLARAEDYAAQARQALDAGERPRIMCPLNDGGLCGVYEHRLMICRMHGVPNVLVKPNGQRVQFAGCFRSQALTREVDDVFVLDRTPLYRDLARLEMDYLGSKLRQLPRVDLTLAEMLVAGPPRF
ncbi:hypothetical protein [Paucidesulfovibrio longus]|uniref:hypothetical protein n=1 Tax=Paucidesulfovibrio longus TaxID=889 RepID=UPI0003B7088F|nr:hypothetical protein [Paucidesulfovibrio longus]